MDSGRYDEAGEILAENCQYSIRDKTLKGRSEIIKSYKDAHKAGESKLDEIVFSSKVEPLYDNSFKLHYLDRLRKSNKWHEHRCEQVIKFENNKITDIVHIDLAGEAEALQEFFKAHQ